MKLTVRYDMDSTVWILWDYNVWYGTEILFLRYLRCSCFRKNYVLTAFNFHACWTRMISLKTGFPTQLMPPAGLHRLQEHCDLISLGEVPRAVILHEKRFVRHKQWGQTLGFEVNLLLLSTVRFVPLAPRGEKGGTETEDSSWNMPCRKLFIVN